MKTLNIEIVLDAARKAGFENISGSAGADSICVGDWYLPPGEFRDSHRLYNNSIEIKPCGKNFKIEVWGWEQNKGPMIYKATQKKVCDGRLDEFMVSFFENFDESYNNTIQFLFDPLKMRSIDRRVSDC